MGRKKKETNDTENLQESTEDVVIEETIELVEPEPVKEITIDGLYKDINNLREQIKLKELQIKELLSKEIVVEIPLHKQLKASQEADKKIKIQKLQEQIELIKNIAKG